MFSAKKMILFITVLLISTTFAFAEDKKILILPFENKADTNEYGMAKIVDTMLFNSVYNFVGVMPGVDAPEKSFLLETEWNLSNIPAVAASNNVDFVIYGDFTMEGDSIEPNVNITVNIWMSEQTNISFTKKYTTGTGYELLDTIDEIIADTAGDIFKRRIYMATLEFRGFEVGSEKYEIFANNKSIATIASNEFEFKMSIVAETNYEIKLKRLRDEVFVGVKNYNLEKGTKDIYTYTAKGSISIAELKGKKRGHTYTLLLNGKEMSEKQQLSDMPAGINYLFTVVDNEETDTKKRMMVSNNFVLLDSEAKEIKPNVSRGGFSLRAQALDGSMVKVGVDYFIIPKLYVGLGMGFSIVSDAMGYTNLTEGAQAIFLSSELNVGFYYIGDRSTDWRFDVGLTSRYTYVIPNDIFYDDAKTWGGEYLGENLNSFIPGIYLGAEWKFLRFQIGEYLDLTANGGDFGSSFTMPAFSLGVRFNF